MNTFDCLNISLCSGIIMAKTKTKPVPVESFESMKHSFHRRNYEDYKKLYTESGILLKNCT